MTDKFKWLLSLVNGPDGKPLTQERWAALIPMGRTRLNQVLNNAEGRGGVRRPQVARDIVSRFGEKAAVMLSELGWDEQGNLVERSTGNVPVEEGQR